MFNLRENYQEDGYAKIDEHPEKESRGLLRCVVYGRNSQIISFFQ